VYISLSAFIYVRTSHEKVAQMREETELRVDNVTSHCLAGRLAVTSLLTSGTMFL
jgi:hypothetical protein